VGDVRRDCARIAADLEGVLGRLARAGGVPGRLPALRRAAAIVLRSPFVRLYGLAQLDDLFEFSATLTPEGRSLCRLNCYDLDPPALAAALRALGGGAHDRAIARVLDFGARAGARLAFGVDFPPNPRDARRKVYVFLWELAPERRPAVVGRAAALVGARAAAASGLELERASVVGFDFRPRAPGPALKLYLRFDAAEVDAALRAGAGRLGAFTPEDLAALAADPYVAPRLEDLLVSYDLNATAAPRATYLGLRPGDDWPAADVAFCRRFLGGRGLGRHAAVVTRTFCAPPFRQLCYVSLTGTRGGTPRVSLYFLGAIAGRRPATAAADAGAAAAAAGAAWPGARCSVEVVAGPAADAPRLRLHFEPLRSTARYYRRSRGYGVAYVTEGAPPSRAALAPLLAWLDALLPALDPGPGTTPAHLRARLAAALAAGLPAPWRAGAIGDEA
jgi:hypothetical protein